MIFQYTIHKDIPIPKKRCSGGRKGESKYPFSTMDVGDCFLVPLLYEKDTSIVVKKMASAVYYYRRTNLTLKEFRVRAHDKHNVGVWRVK